MKKSKGITLVALVITIVILIILAGVGINMAVGENGIFNKAKEAKKAQIIAEAKEKIGTEILEAQVEAIERNESLEKTQIEDIISNYGELQEDGDTIILNDNGYEVSLLDIYNGTVTTIGSYSELKAQNALLKQQLEDASLSESEANKELSKLKETLSQTTATETQILKNYTAYKDGKLITGTMENRGELNWKPTASETYTVPAGYYSGGILDSSDAYNAGSSNVNVELIGYWTVSTGKKSFITTRDYSYVLIFDSNANWSQNQVNWTTCSSSIINSQKLGEFVGTTNSSDMYANAGVFEYTDVPTGTTFVAGSGGTVGNAHFIVGIY